MRKVGLLLFILGLLGLACAATVSQSRKAYITARPHGWIEVSIRDNRIPVALAEKSEPDQRKRPERCRFTVRLNGEVFVDEHVYPTGPSEPFEVDTGFRFPAPAGKYDVTLSYRGCRFEEGEEETVKSTMRIAVQEDHLTPLHFDGEVASAGSIRPDTAVTLEDIYEAVTGRKSPER
jgi:hypothetical protein